MMLLKYYTFSLFLKIPEKKKNTMICTISNLVSYMLWILGTFNLHY